VVGVLDDLPEGTPGANPTGLTLEQYGGNHVVQDIGNGRYAFYAHMQPGSITAKVGDVLKAGDVVGKLGNSGNSDAPHLHFHIMDSPDPLRSNGLPFVFDSFSVQSHASSEDVVNESIGKNSPITMDQGYPAGARTDQMPLSLDVLEFPGG
jgi:murein DD-endopeptidase MepM/ murein hydrolase activator NlpD